MLVRMWRKGILCTLLTGLQIGTIIMENSKVFSKVNKDRTTRRTNINY